MNIWRFRRGAYYVAACSEVVAGTGYVLKREWLVAFQCFCAAVLFALVACTVWGAGDRAWHAGRQALFLSLGRAVQVGMPLVEWVNTEGAADGVFIAQSKPQDNRPLLEDDA